MLDSKQVFRNDFSLRAAIVDVDTAARLRVAIARVYRRLRDTAAGSEAGMTPTRISVLLTVMREGPIRLSELAAAESLNPTMLSRIVASLVERGLLERTSDDEDRRAAWVNATLAGRRLAKHIRQERTDAINGALEGLTVEDRSRLEQALPALEALSEQLRRPRP
jgi:DNA-binding MarR family transcriptional regulator